MHDLLVDLRVVFEGIEGRLIRSSQMALMIMCSLSSVMGATGISITTWGVLVRKALIAKNLPATPPRSEAFPGCWHPRTATPPLWSSASWPDVPWPFPPTPCGSVGSSRASHTRCHRALSLSSCSHRRGTGQAGSMSGSAAANSAPHQKGPKTTSNRLWSWPQLGRNLLLRILLRVEAWGEVPSAQVSWVSAGFEGYELLPLQLRPTSTPLQTGEVLQSGDCTSA